MEDILSSIKRIIAEDVDAPAPRAKKLRAPTEPARHSPLEEEDEVLELNEPAPAEPEESILSRKAVAASRGSLEALSRLIVKPEVEGSDTLEGMVREMLRPMLRDWLDANLPDLVESLVAKEISRITADQ